MKADSAGGEPESSPTTEGVANAPATDDKQATADETSPVAGINAKPKVSPGDNMIDIEDPDDYLLYLEIILKRIHDRFYSNYAENSTVTMLRTTKARIPSPTPNHIIRAAQIADLKQLVPKIRSEVLRGRTLVFSGLVPNQQRLENSRPYLVARSLGASVKQQLTDDTTHLVAATSGTFKVNAVRKRPEIHVVTPEWLWSCAERWECVEERLFPLDPLRPSKQRHPPAHCHSPGT